MKKIAYQSILKAWVKQTYPLAKQEYDLKQKDLAAELKISQPVVHSLLSGNRNIQENEISILEKHFRSSFKEFSENYTDNSKLPSARQAPPSISGAIRVPLVSWVSAGAMAKDEHYQDDFNDYPIAYAPDLDPNGDWIALRVDGRSMDKISPHDSIIFVNRNEKNLVPNACYVVSDGNGGATYKRYKSPNQFEAVSTKSNEYKTITFEQGQEPEIIGRVRKTILSM